MYEEKYVCKEKTLRSLCEGKCLGGIIIIISCGKSGKRRRRRNMEADRRGIVNRLLD